MYPRSNCMPSTISSSVSSDFASSTVITPSLPTFFIASARKRPISASPLAEMVPTWAISSFELTFLEFFCRSATTASTARSTPRLRSIGFILGDGDAVLGDAWRAPRLVKHDIAAFRTQRDTNCMGEGVNSAQHPVARVDRKSYLFGSHSFVPSLAYGHGRRAYPNGSGRSRKTREAINRLFWASGRLWANLGVGEHAHDIALLHDQILDAVDLDLGTGPFAEEHSIAGPQVDGNELSRLVAPARAHGDDLALLGLFLGSVRDDDATGGPFLGLDTLEHNTIVEWTEFHRILLTFSSPES